MKKVLLTSIYLLFLSLSVIAQKDKCSKLFFKERKSSKKSSVFNNKTNSILKTKYSSFFVTGNRTVSISFIKDVNGLKLQFYSQIMTMDGNSIKREIILGQNIKIAFIFEDGSTEIITFANSGQKGHTNSKTIMANQNEIVLTNSLLNKLASTKIISTEIQNPFNILNGSPVKSKKVKLSMQNRIMLIANCFRDKIAE